MATIEVDGVKITLTKDQLKEIDKQRNKKIKVEDINSIEVAEEVLKDCKEHIKCIETDFKREKDWVNYKLETIIEAANYIDNGHEIYVPDFDNSSIYKYLPWFEKKRSGWVLDFVSDCHDSSSCSVGLYFKVESTAELMVSKHLKLYNEYLKG